MKKSISLLPLLLTCLFINVGKTQQITFSKVFSSLPLNSEHGWNIIESDSGYIFITANECVDLPGVNCASLTYLNFNGDIIWRQNIHQSLGYNASHLFEKEGKIYITGRTNTGEPQFLMNIYDVEDGTLLSSKSYGFSNKREWPAGILFLNSTGNNILLYGPRDRNQTQPNEWLPVLMKLTPEGDSLTEYSFNQDYEATLLHQVIETTNSDLIASYAYCPEACFLDLKGGVTCLDTLGNIKWQLDLPYSFQPYTCLVAQIDSQHLAVKWHFESNIPNYDLSPPALYFTDMNGTIQDTFIFHNQSLKEVHNMEAIWEHGLVGCGSNYIDLFSPVNYKMAGWAFRMDENREITWDRTFLDTTGKGTSFGLNQIKPTRDGGYIAVGTINNYMTGVLESHNWILKLDSTGCFEPGCDGINYVTKTEEVEWTQGKAIKVYPNPANDWFSVAFPADFNLRGFSLRLLSAEGRLLRQVAVNTEVQNVRTDDLPAGLYFIVMARGNEIVASKRVVVQR